MTTFEAAHDAEELQRAARDHLWLHFTRMGGGDPPIIVRGDGCYLEDSKGNRYLDALAGLFSVNLGYGFGEEIGQAALEQMRELPFYTNWSYAHPRAIELAAELASLAPGDLNRAFFVSGGSEAVESAWKLARQYYVARDQARLRAIAVTLPSGGEPETRHDAIVSEMRRPPNRYKAIARHIAYHGTTMGALSINGIPALRTPFEPLVPEVRHVHNTNRYHRPPDETEEQFTRFLLDDLEQTIVAMGPETVCMVHMEPVQNAGGAFIAPAGYWQGVRAICDKYEILLSADEVITGFGRLGYWFGSERYDIRPDIMTCAKGLSSSYAAIGAVVTTDRVMQPFLDSTSMYSHGITFGGHPTMCAIALKNIEIMKRERINEHVLGNEAAFRATLEQLLELPIVGDVRGTGYFYAVELVKDKETRETFSDEECETLLRGFLSPRLFERGLICRADDRGDPVIQISPPLVATQKEFDEMTGNPRRHARRGLGQDHHQRREQHVSTDPQLVEETTTFALEERGKLIKSLSRFDMIFFTVCAFVGLDTLGTIAKSGPQGLLLARAARAPLRDPVHARDVGDGLGVHAGGRAVRVGEALVRALPGWDRGDPLLGDEPALGRRLARVHRDERVELEHLVDRQRHGRRLRVQARVHLDLDRRRDHLAPLRQVDPERRRHHARRRARLLLAHGDHLRDQARRRMVPDARAVAHARRSSSRSCRSCSSVSSASSCRTVRPKRWRTRRRTCRCRCCKAGSSAC